MVLCNHHGLKHPVHPGAAGFAIPGHRIVVLDDGRIDAVGCHDELLRTCEIYREVYESQQKGGEDDA